MFDTHVNLHGDAFSEDLDEVISRARQVGISKMLAICDRPDNFENVHNIAMANPDIWCSVGVHPHHSKDFKGLTADDLVRLSQKSKVVAIGETGLDFHYGYSDKEDQVSSLRTHIDAARQTSLPLILHSRNADELMADILDEEFAKGAFRPLLHCYTSGEELLLKGLSLGAYVSASGIITFKSAHDVRRVIKMVPLDRIIVETDCPYLTPVPHRGRRNEPSYLPNVIQGLSELHDIPVSDVVEITTENAQRLFDRAVD